MGVSYVCLFQMSLLNTIVGVIYIYSKESLSWLSYRTKVHHSLDFTDDSSLQGGYGYQISYSRPMVSLSLFL